MTLAAAEDLKMKEGFGDDQFAVASEKSDSNKALEKYISMILK